MCNPRRVLMCILASLAFVPCVGAVTINFDEFPATNNNAPITAEYAGLGVTFDPDNSGTWGGNSAGDPGNWDLEGTNGPAFLGNNGANNGATYVTTVRFTMPVNLLSFDVSRSLGSSSGQSLLVSIYSGAALLDSQFVVLGDINSWTSVLFSNAGIDRLVLDGSEVGFSPYGIDNLTLEGSAVPEPASLALMGGGLLALAARRRR